MTDNHHAVDHSWQRPLPTAAVPDELREMLKESKETANG